jgi:hypothetical protein
LHRQAIPTYYTERRKTKRRLGRVLRWLGQSITTGKLRGHLPIYYLYGGKIARLPRKFSTEAWGKIELFNIFPKWGKT